jgi:hypothetical protein
VVNLKKIFGIILTLFLFTSIPLISGQLSLGESAEHIMVKITLEEKGKVHVLHEIKDSKNVVQVKTVDGTLSNLKVVDKEGNDVDYATTGIDSITGITIFSSKENVLIEYDLDDVLFLKDDIWTWDFMYFQSTIFIFPDGVDLLFINSTPVKLHDAEGVTCHGCNALIEYVIDAPLNIETIHWEDYSFDLGIRTLSDFSALSFNQSTKSISFNVDDSNRFVTLIIPLELLWDPYEVFLDDQKILKHEFFSNETHAWLNFRPESSGTIQIIGTSVVPEFPVLAPLFLGIAAVIAIQLKTKLISARST